MRPDSDNAVNVEPKGIAKKRVNRRDFLKVAGGLSVAAFLAIKDNRLVNWLFASDKHGESSVLDENLQEKATLTNWDRDLPDYLANSFGELCKVVALPRSETLPSGEKIETGDIVASWLLVHALELEIREKRTAGMTLEVFGQYMQPNVDSGPAREYNVTTSQFGKEYTALMDRYRGKDCMGTAFAMVQDHKNPVFVMGPEQNAYEGVQRMRKPYILAENFHDAGIRDTFSRAERALKSDGGIAFKYWFGLGSSHFEDDLALILGQQSRWSLVGQQDVTDPLLLDYSTAEEIEAAGTSILFTSIRAESIRYLQCDGEFGANSFPFTGVDWEYAYLANKMDKVLKPYTDKLPGLVKQGSHDFYAWMTTHGFMSISPYDTYTDRGETELPAYHYVRLTPKFMQILEIVGLAKAIALRADYEPLSSHMVRQGVKTYSDGSPLSIDLDYYVLPSDAQEDERMGPWENVQI